MNKLLRRPHFRHILPDLVVITASPYLSLLLRVGTEDFFKHVHLLNQHIFLFVCIRVLTFYLLGVYKIIWRYVSSQDAINLAKASALSTAFIISSSYLVNIEKLPRSTFIIDLLLATACLSGIRMLRRILYEDASRKDLNDVGLNTLIYGAGSNGRMLINRFKADPMLRSAPVAFIDDDPLKQGRTVSGIPVLGGLETLKDALKDYRIQEVYISTPDIQGPTLREIVQICREFNIRPKVLEPMRNAASNKKLVPFRNVELRDLLNRPQKQIDLRLLKTLIQGKTVLITGAGGSIGSELARQVLSFTPKRLLLLDHSEYNLYQIDHELRLQPVDDSVIVPLLVDIKDTSMLSVVMREHRPEIVFHAAAYKHVDLVENNPHPAILNNVLGTRNLIDLSIATQVSTFVLISTDKAVNPVGVMGSTKRACELMVASAGQKTGKLYCAVRFGNVLGSSGSLIPLLQKQIQNGEPVTITDPEVTRYFMLIPEAVSLVLTAAAISKPGNINVLRMGAPIKIVDIARSLIALMGKTEVESPIVFTGLRPGEKMYEELYLRGDELNTQHPDILVMPKGDSGAASEAEFHVLEQQIETIIDGAMEARSETVPLLKTLANPNLYPSEGQVMSGRLS